jgi:phosphinothricin acetyltransferase
MTAISFHDVTDDVLPQLAGILNYYIEHTTVSFYTEPLSPEEMREKIFFGDSVFRSFIIRQAEGIVGYCSISPWKKQQAYRQTGEVTIYLSPEYTGKGIGGAALLHLVEYARLHDIKVLIAGLCSENQPSQRLFEKNGFELCARFKGVGRKFGRVLDTVYLQLTNQ